MYGRRQSFPFQRNYDFEDTDCKNCFDILLNNCYDDDTNKMKKKCKVFLSRLHPDKGGEEEFFIRFTDCYKKFFDNERSHENECLVLGRRGVKKGER